MWFLYELCFLIGFLVYLPRALWRKRLPHRGWSMRLGRYPAAVIGALGGRSSLWVHAVSVGEVLAARPLLDALMREHPRHPLALSTITPGGFELASKQVNGRGAALYFPLDLRPCVRRALNVLQPRLLLLMESELWPGVIRAARTRGIPIAVVNGRISDRAFPRYRLMKRWWNSTLSRVDLFIMQSQTDADRIIQLGVSPQKVRVVGSLKWEASLSSRPAAEAIRTLAEQLGLNGLEPVIVAGSTHRGEEQALLEALRALRSMDPTVRLIIAPRHLERVAEVEGLGRQAGFATVRASQAASTPTWDVSVVDVFGELPCYYGLATATFIGGSLIPHGGQNPLEAASLGKPIFFGPSMHNFSEIAADLTAHRAARQLRQGPELTPALRQLLADRSEAEAMGRRAQELTERSQGAVQRTLAAIQPLLNS